MGAQVYSFDAPLPSLLYWDASFLVHAVYPAGRYHKECYGFLERVGSAENTLSCISTLALDETIFALIRLKTVEDYPAQGFWELYRKDPQVILPYLEEIQTLVARLAVDPRIRLVGTEREDTFVALDLMDDYACLPRDAMHLAVMSRLGIDSLVTTDDDFVSVDGLALFTGNPRIRSSQ
jgi:predicted nucleic acid-binding protein